MNFSSNKHILRGFLALAAALLLSACDMVPTELNTSLPNDRNTEYSGPACGIGTADPADACSYKVNFWNRMNSYSCDNCHGGGNQSPHFLDQTNVNRAYAETLKVVDRSAPENSRLIAKINTGHQCGSNGECTAMAAVVTGYLNDWINGSSAGGDTGGGNAIVLEAPVQKDAGASKSLPDPATEPAVLANFGATVHPLLIDNCASCHVESAAIPQSPFFSESDVATAYEAIKISQKMDLDTPANSRLVVRLAQEFHNCWDPNGTGSSDCAASAAAMEQAIAAFAGTIATSAVDSNWIISKALGLKQGLVASGGARDDSSTIALYEFKAGSGNVISDTSGVAPPLNLRLEGSEDIDFKWVGGWGIEFLGGHARANTGDSQKLRDRIVASGEFSIEAWVVPGNVSQGTAGDPARIITYSVGNDRRNFTLGQAEYRYEFMQRSSNTNANGEPSLITDADDEDLQAAQQHVVVTYDPVNGRRIYVNGVYTEDADTSTPGSLANWDDSYALVFGSESGGAKAWQGKLRLVAIHDRAMSEAQIEQNFEAGVGEKFLLLFNVSEQLFDPPPAPELGTYVMLEVSQYDSYSYLFYKPTLVSLDPDFTPGNIVVKGLRLGLNGKEPAVGQAFRNIDTTITSSSYTSGGQVLSSLGTIIALEKGADDDEFFLTFEQLGSKTDVRIDMVCGVNASCATPAVDSPAVSDIGLRTFEEINATMAAVTGVDMNAPGNASVKDTYLTVKQQLPTLEDIDGFLPAHQMAIAQLAIQYCNGLVEDPALRSAFYGGFDFDADVATAYGSGDSTQKQQMLDALYDNMIGLPDAANTALNGVPARADLKAELFGPASSNPDNLFDRLSLNMQDVCASTDPEINQYCDNGPARTRAIAKALCTTTLGSAAMLIQ